MSVTESQRRMLDLAAEEAGWTWADVEALAELEFRDCVAGLSAKDAERLLAMIPMADER